MANLQPRTPCLSNSSASNDGPTPLSNRPKLRNSCGACASSKLKCSQEKPTCSRCAKRNLTCEYVLAKRGGRKLGSRTKSTEHRNSDSSSASPTISLKKTEHLPPGDNRLGPALCIQDADALNWLGLMHSSSETGGNVSSNRFHDLFGLTDPDQTVLTTPTSLETTSTRLEPDLNDFFMSPLSFPTDLSGIGSFRTGDLFSMDIGTSTSGSEPFSAVFPGFEDTVSDCVPLSAPSSTPETSSSSTKDISFGHLETYETGQSCTCLVQALGLMKQLFPVSTGRTGLRPDVERTISPASTIQEVIAKNETTIEALSCMLSCSCSHDGYQLTVMSLIIFKVIGRYSIVARKTPCLQGSATDGMAEFSPSDPTMSNNTVVGFCLDGADSARMTTQLVLNELHRVRCLVDQLSTKLQAQASKADTDTAEPPGLHSDMMLPLSAGMYDQLDRDLRKRLRAVSWEMIDRLRKL